MYDLPVSRRTLLIVSVLLLPMLADLASAQSHGSVDGTVYDADTDRPLKGATVKLVDVRDTTMRVFGAITGDNGAFHVQDVTTGRAYRLEVTHIAYRRFVADSVVVRASDPRHDVGRIRLDPRPAEIGEIEVTAQRAPVTVTADKTVYAVENNPAYTATTISELLGQIPSVDVDQDGKISLRGDADVMIMMNGRPMTMPVDQRNKMLQSLPVDMVKDIEIRTNPGAQFDARNKAGIINIVTRRTMKDMLGGNVNGGVDSRESVSGGLGLYVNGGDINASVGGGIYHGSNDGSRSSLRLNYIDSVNRKDVGDGSSNSTSNSLYAYGQIDYSISSHDLASLSFNLNNWSSDYTFASLHTFFDPSDAVVGTLADTNAPRGTTGNDGGANQVSFLYRHTFEGDHKIDANFSYEANGYNGDGTYGATYREANGTVNETRSTERITSYDHADATIIASVDYNYPVGDTMTLSLGAKNEINNLDNATAISYKDKSTGEYLRDTLQSNHYLPKNAIYSIYGNIAYKLIDGLTIQGGVRVERAEVSARYLDGAEIIARNYTNVFPSGSLSYNLTDRHTLTVSYRRSIALPDIDALNPTKVKWSDLNEYSGNPDLEPEFTQSIELNYNTYWGGGNVIAFGPYYSTSSGSIESSQQLIGDVTSSTYANFNGHYSLGVEGSVSIRPVSWLNVRASGNVYSRVNRGSSIPGDLHTTATGSSASGSLNVDLLDGMTLSMSIYTTSPAAVGGSQESGFSYSSFALRQRLLDNALTIMLRANDPFKLQKWESRYDTDDFHTESLSTWSSRFIGLNVTYSFGTTPRMEEHRQEKTETKGGGGSGGGGGEGGGAGGK